jgi:polar amino acid transport system permease protein
MDWSTVLESIPSYAQPLVVTIQVTVAASALALVVAFVLGLMTASKHLAVRTPARFVVEFIRGSSVIVQLFWIAYAMPALLGIRLDYQILAGIIALALNYGAYCSEVVRSAIAAVPKGQWEACTALNFTTVQKMRLVVIPQAWPEMIPSLCSFAIMLLKASALVSLIGITDITAWATVLGSDPGQNRLLHYSVILVIYFVLAWLIWTGMRALERRAKRGIGVDTKPTPTGRQVSLLTAMGGTEEALKQEVAPSDQDRGRGGSI